MRKNKKKIIIVTILIIIFILYIAFWDKHPFHIFCPLHEFTGIYCPGCGITRMLTSLMKGEIYQAFRYNPGVFVLLPFLLIYLIEKMISFFKQRPSFFDKKMPQTVWYVLLIIMIIYGVLRNIPAFDFLAPTVI